MTPAMLPRRSSSANVRGAAIMATIALGVMIAPALGLQALGYLGLSALQCDKIAAAILSGVDIASAIAMFAGPIAVGGVVLWAIKAALKKASKAALVY